MAADETLPITVLDARDIARGGLDSLSKVIQTLPMSATSVLNTNVNNGGNGSARVDLRSLQPKRTLVLLNGHRLPDGGIGGDDSVDLNSLPVSMIDRVEILTSGASAIYGADAVAGVVNFITKSGYDGIDLRAERSEASRSDGGISTISFTLGHALLHGEWMLGGEYVNQDPVHQSARAYSAVPLTISDPNGDLVPNGNLVLPDGAFFVPEGNALGLDSGPYTRVSGTTGRSAANFRPINFDTDYFNYAPYSYLQTPSERGSVWLMGTQPLTANTSFHFEGLANHRRSSQQLAPTPFFTGLDPAPLLPDGSPGIPADNYYNPFGVDVPRARRRFVEIADRRERQRVDMNRELVGLNVQFGSWNIEPTVSLSQSHATETDLGAIPGERLATALGPSGPNAQGQIVCGVRAGNGIVPASAVIPGCVPVDIFGGVGSVTPEQIAYLQQTLVDHGRNSQRDASVNAQGPLGAVSGGPIQWATGVEYRREEGSYILDPKRGTGAVGSGGQSPIPDVAISTREAYLEMRAPLERAQFLAEALDAAVGVRYSGFSTSGGHFTWQGGLRWQPLQSLTLRTNYAKVFRAPSLTELYVPQSANPGFAVDPCGNNPTAAQRANCVANGVPGGQYVQSQDSALLVLSGGNSRLAPEKGYTFDSGIDIRPAALPNFRASIDVYQIDLSGYIENPDTSVVLQQCAYGGRTDICKLIRRASDGSVIAVSTLPQNFGDTMTRGVDLATSLSEPSRAGQFSLSLRATYLARFDTQLFPGAATLHGAGTYSPFASALPHWRSLAHLDFDRGPWHAGYSTQWIGSYHECNLVDFTDQPYCRRVQNVLYHDVEAAFTLRASLTVRLGVNNFTDRQPPYLNFGNDANTDTSIYRLLGRSFFAAIRCQIH
ncbi:MAG: TonB-dependent receptor [Gammaproteobacteria bacterium]